MTTRAIRTVSVAAGLLTIGLIVFTFQVIRSKAQIETRLAEATQRQATLRAELKRAQRDPAKTETKPPVEVAPAPAKAAASAEPAFPARIRPPSLMDFARNNPQLWNDFIQSKRVELGRLYLPLMLRLNLSSQQQERFKDIFEASLARGSDIGAAADAQGLAHTDPAIVALREGSERQQKNELAELLGPAGFEQFQNFERALPLRGFVDGFAIQVAAHAPLSAQQANQLERALTDANEPYRNGKRAEPREVDWESVDRRAREILTPEQFEAWQLGVAHNMFGGSRRAQELTTVYQRAVKRMKESEGAGAR